MALSLFQGFGVEIECMIVDAATLDVMPVADRLLRTASAMPGAEVIEDSEEGDDPQPCEVALGPISWSNELTAHVIEFKTTEPAPSLEGVAAAMASNVERANAALAPMGARILPGAMHPWMDPGREMTLWKHGYSEVYAAFDRIFGCRGHGWSNLQSAHLNLPFAEPGDPASEREDGEFGRLHAAVRLLLPIIPALSAASPIVEGRVTGTLDSRLEVYRLNQRRVPSVAGRVIPERVFTKRDYVGSLLAGVYRDIAPLDPGGVLQHEWLNSRGAIARFSRNSIEVRVIDAQECAMMDLAIIETIVRAARALCEERWVDLKRQQAVEVEPLERALLACIRDGERAVIEDAGYLGALGVSADRTRAEDVWYELGRMCGDSGGASGPLAGLLERGPLARRILAALGNPAPGTEVPRERLREVYGQLAACATPGTGAPAGRAFVA